MAELYPIFKIRSDSKELIEQLGSKPKFWFRLEGDTQPWLFKYTRDGTGEHWSEKVAAEIAKLIELPAATVELADLWTNGDRPPVPSSVAKKASI